MTTSSTARHICVIGGGIVGTLTAWRLLESGFKVTLLERDMFGLGCSTGNAGSVSAGSVVPLGMPGMWKQVPGWLMDPDGPLHIRGDHALQVLPWLVRFLKASTPERVESISHALKALTAPSVGIYREIVAKIGASSLLQVNGQLQVYSSDVARQKDAAGWALRRARGVVVQEVSAGEIRDLEPAIAPELTHGIYLPNEGMIVNPARLVRQLAESFVANGGTIKECLVKGFDIDGNRQIKVLTDQGTIQPDDIVIAAGAWSHTFASQFGDDVPLESQRGYHVSFPSAGIKIQRTVVASETKCFATPMEQGLRLAGTVEFGSLTAPANSRRVKALLRHSKTLFPDLDASTYTDWMGNRPCLPDSLPVVGRATNFANVYYAFGHGHLGVTCAPVTADIITSLVMDKQPAINLDAYSPTRF